MGRKPTQTANDLLEVKKTSLENAKTKLESQKLHMKVMEKAIEKTQSEIDSIEEFIDEIEAEADILREEWDSIAEVQSEYNSYLFWLQNGGKFQYELEIAKNGSAEPDTEAEFQRYMQISEEYERRRDAYYNSRAKLDAKARSKFYLKKVQ